MTMVDLTPEELKASYQRRRRLRTWIALLAVALAVAIALFAVRRHELHREQCTVAQITDQADNIRAEMESLRLARDSLDDWKRRLALLDEVRAYADFPTALDFLAAYTPDLIYLDSLTLGLDGDTGPRTPTPSVPADAMFKLREVPAASPADEIAPLPVSITGRAANHDVVAEYLAILEHSGHFSAISLGHARRRANAQSPPYVEFTIDALLPPHGQPTGDMHAALQTTTNF